MKLPKFCPLSSVSIDSFPLSLSQPLSTCQLLCSFSVLYLTVCCSLSVSVFLILCLLLCHFFNVTNFPSVSPFPPLSLSFCQYLPFSYSPPSLAVYVCTSVSLSLTLFLSLSFSSLSPSLLSPSLLSPSLLSLPLFSLSLSIYLSLPL